MKYIKNSELLYLIESYYNLLNHKEDYIWFLKFEDLKIRVASLRSLKDANKKDLITCWKVVTKMYYIENNILCDLEEDTLISTVWDLFVDFNDGREMEYEWREIYAGSGY